MSWTAGGKLKATPDHVLAPPLFVPSTFVDTRAERDDWQRYLWPRLKVV